MNEKYFFKLCVQLYFTQRMKRVKIIIAVINYLKLLSIIIITDINFSRILENDPYTSN